LYERSLAQYDKLFFEMEGEEWFTFMNHGYLPTQYELTRMPKLSSDDDMWRHQIYLYFHLINRYCVIKKDNSVRRVELFDIGCGRGGGLSAIKRYYEVEHAVGIDINTNQIAFCRNRHSISGLEFHEGNALHIPVDDETFDFVINVESCHSYPDVGGFLSEAYRVLRPGGVLFLTDVRHKGVAELLLDFDVMSSALAVEYRGKIGNYRLDVPNFRAH
jgi:ubiquinone/menaquinone biosynthesis C-methylase UbiE